jgi:uncharacterized membrane protein YqgA involved in biofilm formation
VAGSIFNAACILAAALAVGLGVPEVPARIQRRLQTALGVVALALGFHVIWGTLGDSFSLSVKRLLVVMLALILGRLTGQTLGLQTWLNAYGRFAGEVLTDKPGAGNTPRIGEVFLATTTVFCLTPLAVLGPLQEAWAQDFRVLVLKGAVDGMATLTLARSRGPIVALAAVPVLSLQGTLTLGFSALAPGMLGRPVAEPTLMAGGFLLIFVSLVMLQAVRVRLADYLPALLWTPLLAWLLA